MHEFKRTESDEVKRLKTHLTLDFSSAMRSRDVGLLSGTISTPDVGPGMLKLGTPELEQIILQQQITTGPLHTLFSSQVSEEQEKIAKDFFDVLLEGQINTPSRSEASDKKLEVSLPLTGLPVNDSLCRLSPHGTQVKTESTFVTDLDQETSHTHSEKMNVNNYESSCESSAESSSLSQTPALYSPSSLSSPASLSHPSSGCYESEVSGTHCAGIKRSYDCMMDGSSVSTALFSPCSMTLDSSPTSFPFLRGITPIDMEQQERIKLDRKRARNRVAATKCRERKMERISSLEEQVRQLKCRNVELTQLATTLRDAVYQMKLDIVTHINGGCHLMMRNMYA